MKIGKWKLPSKRAVSPVIATLLMVAIAVAASIIVYIWSMGLMGGLMVGGGEQTKEQLVMESYKWDAAFKVTVRNVGAVSVTIDAVYVNGTLATGIAGVPSTTVAPWEKTELTLTGYGSGHIKGVAYLVKVATKSGGLFSFSCTYGRAG